MKFISSSYDANTGESKVIMQHLGIKFEGSAKIHPEDIENKSEYAGGSYAETRATIKALKYERKIAKTEADNMIAFVKSCECYSKFDKNSDTAKVMYRQLNRRIKKVNDLADQINNLYMSLEKAIIGRSAVIKALQKKKMSKEDN